MVKSLLGKFAEIKTKISGSATKQYLEAGGWQIVVVFSNALLSFVLVKKLGPDSYGQFVYWSAAMSFAAVFGLPGFAAVITKTLLLTKYNVYGSVKKTSLKCSLIGVAVIILYSIIKYAAGLSNRDQVISIMLIGLSLPVTVLSFYDSVLIGCQRMHLSRKMNAVGSLIVLTFVLLGCSFSGNVNVIILSLIIGKIVSGRVGDKIANLQLRDREVTDHSSLQWSSLGWSQTVIGLGSILTANIDKLILEKISFSEVAFYQSGILVPTVIRSHLKIILNYVVVNDSFKLAYIKWVVINKFLIVLACAASSLISLVLMFFYVIVLFGQNNQTASHCGIIASIGLIPFCFSYLVTAGDQIYGSSSLHSLCQITRLIATIGVAFMSYGRGATFVAAMFTVIELAIALLCLIMVLYKRFGKF